MYRLDDFRIQLDGRVTKEYVEVIGRQIKSSIIDSVSTLRRSGNYFGCSSNEKMRTRLTS